MAVDAGDILSSWMQGSNFVNNNIARVEEERRRQELEETQRVAGKVANMFAPKFDANGKPIARSMGDLFNDPEALELVNHPFMRDVRMQGITDPEVEDVQIVAGVPLPDGARAIPVMEQRFKDGHVSRGPLTADRSRNPDARVVSLDRNDAFNHLAAAVYARSPALGKELMNRAHQQSMGALQTLYRNAPTQEERNQILAAGQSYGMPADEIIKGAAAPVTLQDASGIVTTKGPDGSTTVSRDPTVFERVGRPAYEAETDLAVGRKQRLADADLLIAEQQAGRKDQLDVNSAKARALADIEFKETFGPRINEIAAQQQRSSAAVEEDLRQKYFPQILDRKVKELDATTDAQAKAGLRNAPTTAATSQITQPGFKVRQDDEQGLLKAREILNPSAVPALLSKGASASEDAVLQYAPKLTPDDQKGLYAALARRVEAGDPAAIPALRTLKRVMHDAAADAGGKGEAPKPAEYDATGVDKWTVDLPDDERRKVRLQGEQVFRDLQAAAPVIKGSQEEAVRNMAVAEALRIGLPTHALPLENWVGLQRDPAYASGVGDAREFLDEIHTPIVELSKQQGLSMSPRVLSQTERLAVGLKARGIANSDAVTKALEVEKNPALVDKIVRLFPEGASPAEREKIFLDTLAADLKTDRARNLKSTLREGADYTFGGGMMR